jgi:Ala-tRNA(Pro) deacylase
VAGAHDRIVNYLDSNGVKYEIIRHRPAASADEYHQVLGTRYEQQAKSVFLRVKRAGEKHFAILAIQSQKRVDLQRAAAFLGARIPRGTAALLGAGPAAPDQAGFPGGP